VQEFNVQFKSD